MVSVVSRLLSGGDEFGPSAARSFGSVFSEITDDDLASEGFERFIPEFVSSVSAWSGPGSIFEKPHTKDDPGDITVSLNEELVEKNLIPPPFEWSDYGDDDLQE